MNSAGSHNALNIPVVPVVAHVPGTFPEDVIKVAMLPVGATGRSETAFGVNDTGAHADPVYLFDVTEKAPGAACEPM